MSRPVYIFAFLATLFIAGYSLAFAGNRWYLEVGATYFHFLGGVGIAALVTSYYSTEFAKIPQPLRFFSIVGITIGIGVLWEFHEYILQQTIGGKVHFQGDLADTMSDLLMDTLGAVVVALNPFGRGNR